VETGNESHKQFRISVILTAVIGMIFIAAFFFLVMESPSIKLLRPHPEALKESIIFKAESFYRQVLSPEAAARDHKQRIETYLDKKLFKYIQYHKKETGAYPDLSPAAWWVTWYDGGGSYDDHDPSRDAFEVSFDFKGNLTGFQARREDIKPGNDVTLPEDDALLEAKYFLETQNIDSEALVIANKDIRKTGTATTYKFTLKDDRNRYPHLTEIYKVEVVGEKIIGFKKDISIDEAALGWKKQDQEKMIAYTVQVIIWLAIILVLVILFIRKLRRDELEFKQAFLIGIVVTVGVFLMMVIMAQESWWQLLIGGGILAGLSFLGVIILVPTAEAVNRNVWPEKLQVSDLLFQGRGVVWETGAGILHTYFITGFTLLMFGLLVLAASYWNLGYIKLFSKQLGVFQDMSGALFITIKNIAVPLLIGFLFLSFWPAYLKRKTGARTLLFIALLAVTFDIGGVYIRFFDPPYLSAILVFPIAVFWAYAVFRWDLFTVMLSFIWVNFMINLSLVLVIPGTVFSTQGMAVVISMTLAFVLGVYLLFKRRSAKDFDTYVPEYVSRIAERERFLKELEIARGVQMRFLPQQVPHSPNLEIVSLCQPAMEVGGDYFDFIRRNDRYMTVLIGDVSGKGVSAAFYMTMVKGIIKTLSKKTLEPAKLLAEANEIFYENAPRDVFITIIYGIFDLQEKVLTVASAGHNPLIVWRHGSRKTSMSNPRGVALGLADGEKYRELIEEERIPFNERDTFIFYTDGVSEAMNMEDEIFGEERLLQVIESHGHQSPQQLQERIVEAVADFSGKAPQHDDFTMVVVKVRPKG
jgi:hypothetical protein